METDTFAITGFTQNRKKVRGFALKSFYQLRELKGNGATWAYSSILDDMISELTKQNSGHVIVKKESVMLGDLVIIRHGNDYYALNFYSVEDYIVQYNAWIITREMALAIMAKKESAIYSR